MYQFSRALEHGLVVSLRGDKFIRLGRRAKPAGIFQRGGRRKTLTEAGPVWTEFPRGVAVWGVVEARTGNELP